MRRKKHSRHKNTASSAIEGGAFFVGGSNMPEAETAPKTSEWRTPKYIFDSFRDQTGARLAFGLDPCSPEQGVCHVPARRIYTKGDDGLLKPWPKHELIFMNPPYSEARHSIVEWVAKYFEHGNGIALIPARTSCDWWHQYVFPLAELLCFPNRKISFLNPDGTVGGSPTLGNALIGMGTVAREALRRSGLGHCVIVDRSAAPPARPRRRAQMVLPLVAAESPSDQGIAPCRD
jgi:DNA N-6-adenine-methyltransferase (Dam)